MAFRPGLRKGPRLAIWEIASHADDLRSHEIGNQCQSFRWSALAVADFGPCGQKAVVSPDNSAPTLSESYSELVLKTGVRYVDPVEIASQ
jgi:hypothetical protein